MRTSNAVLRAVPVDECYCSVIKGSEGTDLVTHINQRRINTVNHSSFVRPRLRAVRLQSSKPGMAEQNLGFFGISFLKFKTLFYSVLLCIGQRS